jgi:uncharacterized protein (TIGR02246 family)
MSFHSIPQWMVSFINLRKTVAVSGAPFALMLLSTAGMPVGSPLANARDIGGEPQAAIEKMLAVEQAAWNSGDSLAYAEVFTDDSDFINIRGQVFSGKAAVREQHARIFAGPFKGSTISIVLRRFTLLSAHVALVDTDQSVTNFHFLPPGIVETSGGLLVTHFKYLAVQQTDGTWKFTSGQNTAVLPK